MNQLVAAFKHRRCGSAQSPVQLLTRFKRLCELQLSWTVDVSRSGLGGSCDRDTRRIPGFSSRNWSCLFYPCGVSMQQQHQQLPLVIHKHGRDLSHDVGKSKSGFEEQTNNSALVWRRRTKKTFVEKREGWRPLLLKCSTWMNTGQCMLTDGTYPTAAHL